MTLTPDSLWQYHEGRDRDGDRFRVHYLAHGSGRVIAKVFGPVSADEFLWRASFYVAVPESVIDTNESFEFIDSDSAIRFVDGILSQFEPMASPQPKPVGEPAKRKESLA